MPPKHQPSPDGASMEDTTHQAPPPPIPGQDLSFRLGGMAGVWRRAHGYNSNEPNNTKGPPPPPCWEYQQEFPPGSSSTTSSGSTPTSPDPVIRGPESGESSKGEQREGEPVLQIWSRGGRTSPRRDHCPPGPRSPNSRGIQPAPPARAASRRTTPPHQPGRRPASGDQRKRAKRRSPAATVISSRRGEARRLPRVAAGEEGWRERRLGKP